MGKRKPSVPRRRVGANFVDLTIERNVYVDPRRLSTASASSITAAPSTLWAAKPTQDAAGALAAGMSLPLPSVTAAAVSKPHSPRPAKKMHIQQGNSTAETPHLHHITKPAVATVPLALDDSGCDRAQRAPPTNEETVTVTVAELEAWKKRTVMQIEDHFTNEQLKRIAEFGRVHANLVKEAKEYVAGVEAQLKEQFERERESLKEQAEAYVSQFQQENEQLRHRVRELEEELAELSAEEQSEDELLDEEPVGVSATVGFSPDTTTTAATAAVANEAFGGTRPVSSDSGDGTSMDSHSPDAHGSDETNESAICVDAVAEAMSRSMEIRTPRLLVPDAAIPKEVLQLSTKTNGATQIDKSVGSSSAELLAGGHAQVPLPAEEDYL